MPFFFLCVICSSHISQRIAYLVMSRRPWNCRQSLSPPSTPVKPYQLNEQVARLYFLSETTISQKRTKRTCPFLCTGGARPLPPRTRLRSFGKLSPRPWRSPELQRFFKQLCKSWGAERDRDTSGMSPHQVELLFLSLNAEEVTALPNIRETVGQHWVKAILIWFLIVYHNT